MELKRVLTKRMRIRKNTPPGSIELPVKKLGLDGSMPSTPSGYGAPETPTTPGIEEFVSIAFEDQPQAQSQPQSQSQSAAQSVIHSPSHRSLREQSTRSSRSASLASFTAHDPISLTPSLSIPTLDSEQPASPASLDEENDSDADEMAQHILDTVQQGGQKWAL